ncbi:MAG TPA: hypothetical protein VGC42_04635 [Kofleriaceae bacterium]
MSKLGLFAMFARLAEAPEPGTGAWKIRTDDGREGVVLMEAGRLCWANHELGGRLSEQIERRYGVGRAVIEQVSRQCREQATPFGATLVELGHLTQDQLSSAMREHTCRSILSLVKSGIRDSEWVAHQGAGYAPETTISVTQAACRCVALVKNLDAEGFEASLETMLDGDAAGMLIHIGSRLPYAASASVMSWQQLRGWLTWTLRADTAAPLVSRGYATGRGAVGGWVTWRSGDIVGVAVTRNDDAQRRLLLRVSSSLGSWTVQQP